MHWREQVAQLEREGNFDIAVFWLEKVIKENPDEMDAYIFLLYRFMDSALENGCYWANVSKDPLRDLKKEYYEEKIQNDYPARAQRCFDESYARFANDAEYLYYASSLLRHSYFMIEIDVTESFLEDMYERATASGYNSILERASSGEVDDVAWARRVISDASLREQLVTKGAAGEYIVGGVLDSAKQILKHAGIPTDV